MFSPILPHMSFPVPPLCPLLFSQVPAAEGTKGGTNGATNGGTDGAVSVAYRFFHEATGSCVNGTSASNCVQFSVITPSSKAASTIGESGEGGNTAVEKDLDDTILHLPKSDMTNVTGGML